MFMDYSGVIIPQPIALIDYNIHFPLIVEKSLDAGLNMSIYADKHSKPFVVVDWIFSMGYVNTRPELLPFIQAILFNNGTYKYNAKALREYVDFYGASLFLRVHANFSKLRLFVPNRYAQRLLALVEHIFNVDIMPNPQQFAILKNRILTQHAIQIEKNDYRAACELELALHGAKSPYNVGYNAEDLQSVEEIEVINFFQQLVREKLYHIFIAGKPMANLVQRLAQYFANYKPASYPERFAIPSSEIRLQNKHLPAYRSDENGTQVSIQMGCRIVDNDHEDFVGIKVLNTAFGGYFGSRLMQYIREQKGYTYGIYSEISSYLFHSNWEIHAQVNSEHRDQCIEDIYQCMRVLQTELIETEELLDIKNNLIRKLLKSLQNPLNIIHTYQQLLLKQKGLDDFSLYAEYIRQVSSAQLMQLAQRYLSPEAFVVITALG